MKQLSQNLCEKYINSYEAQRVYEIINETRPVNIYDFKTYKVSSNKLHFTSGLDEMIQPTTRIIKSLSNSI